MTPVQILSLYCPLGIAYLIIMGLFFKNRRELRKLRAEALEAGQAAANGVSTLSMELQGIREGMRQMEECPVGGNTAQGINLTKRAQVLRMYRRGETIPSIAAALRSPLNEVHLVLKVHHMLQG